MKQFRSVLGGRYMTPINIFFLAVKTELSISIKSDSQYSLNTFKSHLLAWLILLSRNNPTPPPVLFSRWDSMILPYPIRWHNIIWIVSHPDELAPGRISSGWLKSTAVCHPESYDSALCHTDEINLLIPKSSGWLSYRQYLIRTTYGHCRMSTGWLTKLSYLVRMTQHHLNPKSSGWVSSWSYLIRMT